MLISFSVKNWMSFRDQVTLSMVASRERQHGERVPNLGKFQTRVLPIAAIYGGNAAGKTNFFKALSFARTLIVKGTHPDSLIAVEPFRLDSKTQELPSSFSLELLIDEIIYAFSFSVTRKTILEEKLVLINSTSEKVLYHRLQRKPNFDASLAKDQFLQFAFKGTRDNQLFLTNSVSQQVDNFRPVYDWFKDTLELVAPDSRFEPFEQFLDEAHPLYATMNQMLPQLDTGIAHLGSEEIPFDNIPLPETMRMMLQEDVKEGTSVRLMSEPINERLVVTRKEGELIAKKLVSYHPKSDGSEAKFEIRQESDGSQRVIDLLPAFLELSAQFSKKVFVIDEVDRSLHTLLTRRLLEAYLANCTTESRSQLLLTTHDVLLMDQQLLRRDEMWVAERDNTGASTLLSFSDYKDVRYDKDIRKSYLQGRLGGIPRILLGSAMANPGPSRENTAER
ncbi:AAA family ATPase [Methylosarcina fibrata]|jgi:AAA15 family ATPase/GTPase|uniref:AAA family ATPase n=1 Tax=Methylosarcina fibrata TaxID=105972 RepID=UPI00039A5180|nr:ATP-binding protein [Methylosarcina fibrata]